MLRGAPSRLTSSLWRSRSGRPRPVALQCCGASVARCGALCSRVRRGFGVDEQQRRTDRPRASESRLKTSLKRDFDQPRGRAAAWPPHIALSHSGARRLAASTLVALLDALIVTCGFALALELRFDASIPAVYAEQFRLVLPGLLTLYVGANLAFGMYSRVWRYASLRDALILAWSAGAATALAFVADAALFPMRHPLPLTVVPVGGLLSLCGIAVLRFRHRLFEELVVAFTRQPRSRVLIVGAGRAGQRLARELLSTPSLGYRPVCFVDDDPDKQERLLHGLRVAGACHEVSSVVGEYEVDTIAFAIPSLSAEARRQVLTYCEAAAARVKIMPGIPDLLGAQPSDGLLRDARLEDLLGRQSVAFPGQTDDEAIRRSVMITGAAGSIGAELARQVVAAGARRLILLDVDESGLFDLNAELKTLPAAELVHVELVVADITRPERIDQVMADTRPAVVFHAAAYKHVPLMEAHPEEAMLVNVLGTLNVFLSAEQSGCERVVFVSTDKAVAPANVMGATKRLGELLVRAFAGGRTMYCAVRFGNVLGSRGSVVPTFLRQIHLGGPLTITHPAMRRYFMTIPEAVNLIIVASNQAIGGEIFILDMGEPVSILDLARKMIRLHGLRPGHDIEIREIGIRPGEKLWESLTGAEEELLPTLHPRVSRVLARQWDIANRHQLLDSVRRLCALVETGQRNTLVNELYALVGADVTEALAPSRASA